MNAWLLTDEEIDEAIKNDRKSLTLESIICIYQDRKTKGMVREWAWQRCPHDKRTASQLWGHTEKRDCHECWRELMEARG